MNSALDWLKGRTLTKVEKKDYTWFFSLKPDGHVATESYWRLIAKEKLVIASDDHGHFFGLKEPVDAVHIVATSVGSRTIVQYSLSDVNDLILDFGDKIQLQFFNTSGGYESWRAGNNSISIFSLGGGGLTTAKK